MDVDFMIQIAHCGVSLANDTIYHHLVLANWELSTEKSRIATIACFLAKEGRMVCDRRFLPRHRPKCKEIKAWNGCCTMRIQLQETT
jgi:hypothetical protein